MSHVLIPNLIPTGACVRTEATQSNLTCTSPSFTPIFVDLLDSIGLAPTMQAALPDQFPPAPTALFLSLLLGALTLGSALLSSAAIHGPKKLGFLAKKQVLFRKVALLCGVISLVAGLVATICLRVQLAKAVRQWNELGAGEASLWTGFPRECLLKSALSKTLADIAVPSLAELWAGFALEAVSVLLLVSEGLTSR